MTTMAFKTTKTYSTLEVSRICHVDPVTVARWCDQGQIKCFRTPGGHRRMLERDLVEFLKRQQIPVPSDLGPSGTKVMIVDDDPTAVKLVRAQLLSIDPTFIISSASNGLAALLKIGTDIPDLLILDILMPHMDGVEVCRRIKENPKTASIHVVAITGSADPKRSKAVRRAGAAACLIKPFDAATLATCLPGRAAATARLHR